MAGGTEHGPIVQYWHSGAPPPYIEELLDTFREHNPETPHLVFDAAGAEKLIAVHFGDREAAAFRACAVPAMQADYFRYCAALALGGLYCDADLRCIASLRPDFPRPGEGWLILRPHKAIVNGLFAFGSPGHPLLELTVAIATANIERRRGDSVYMVTGPALWTTLYWAFRLGSFDAFVDEAPDAQWEKYARLCSETIGDYTRLSRAFEGVRVRPVSEIGVFVQSYGLNLPYKETDAHWANFKDRIYAEPTPRRN